MSVHPKGWRTNLCFQFFSHGTLINKDEAGGLVHLWEMHANHEHRGQNGPRKKQQYHAIARNQWVVWGKFGDAGHFDSSTVFFVGSQMKSTMRRWAIRSTCDERDATEAMVWGGGWMRTKKWFLLVGRRNFQLIGKRRSRSTWSEFGMSKWWYLRRLSTTTASQNTVTRRHETIYQLSCRTALSIYIEYLNPTQHETLTP